LLHDIVTPLTMSEEI